MNRTLGAVAVALSLLGCYRASPAASHMWRHYDRADDVQELVRLGEIDRARNSAGWIAQNPSVKGFPAGTQQFVENLQVYAGHVADAAGIEDAATATGQLGRACGSCHLVADGGPQLENVGNPPEISASPTQQMTRHRWAADRMWDGLVTPSEASWLAGAKALSRAPLYQRWLTNRWDAYQQVQQLAEQVEQIGHRGVSADTWEERALVYGEFLASCAACHTLVRDPTKQP